MVAQVTAANNTPVDSSRYSLYNLEPGLVYDSTAGNFTMTMELTIEEGLTITVPSHELGRQTILSSVLEENAIANMRVIGSQQCGHFGGWMREALRPSILDSMRCRSLDSLPPKMLRS